MVYDKNVKIHSLLLNFYYLFVIIILVINYPHFLKGKDTMISKEVVVKNMEGLHARPATLFIQKANTFKSSVWIENGDRRANAKSLLGVLSLGISMDMKIVITADGVDEEDAVNELAALIATGLVK